MRGGFAQTESVRFFCVIEKIIGISKKVSVLFNVNSKRMFFCILLFGAASFSHI